MIGIVPPTSRITTLASGDLMLETKETTKKIRRQYLTPEDQKTRLQIRGVAQDTDKEDIKAALNQFVTTTETYQIPALESA